MNKIEIDAVPAAEGTPQAAEMNSAAETNSAAEMNGTASTAVMNPEFHPETFSVDHYADRLMDEVFARVDQLLETGEDPEQELAEAGTISIQTLKIPDVAPLAIIPDGSLSTAEPDSTEPAGDPVAEPAPAKKDWSLRVLLGLALASLAGATAMAATQWQSYRSLYLQMTGQATTTAIAPAPSIQPLSPNQEFATYIQRSLDVLKDQTALAQASGNLALTSPPAVLQVPPAAIPPITGPAAPVTPIAPIASAETGPGKIIERIYIPVYQTPNGYVPVDPNTPISPEVAAAGIPITAPQQPTAPTSPLPKANPSQAEAAAAPSPAKPSEAGQVAIAQPQLPAVEYTLVGLLELGNSSAALFEINGVTRRFSLGERVGGWTLAEVKNGEATLRKDGSVRSVFVGQSF